MGSKRSLRRFRGSQRRSREFHNRFRGSEGVSGSRRGVSRASWRFQSVSRTVIFTSIVVMLLSSWALIQTTDITLMLHSIHECSLP